MSGSVWILLRLLSVEIFHIDKPDPSSPPPGHIIESSWQMANFTSQWRVLERIQMTGADTATGGYLVSRYLVTHSSYLPPPCQTCQLGPTISPNITKLWLHSLNFTVLQPLTKMGSNNYIVGIYLPPNILACGKLVSDDPKLEPAYHYRSSSGI